MPHSSFAFLNMGSSTITMHQIRRREENGPCQKSLWPGDGERFDLPFKASPQREDSFSGVMQYIDAEGITLALKKQFASRASSG
jgi:hypothetical protein